MTKRPCYLFLFSEEENANAFLAYAKKHKRVHLAQNPYDGTGRTVKNAFHVLVTATNGFAHDPILHHDLIQKAEELGGYYQPR